MVFSLPLTLEVFSVLLMVDSKTLTLANVGEAFSCLEITLGTFETLWAITQVDLGAIFVGPPMSSICLTVDW